MSKAGGQAGFGSGKDPREVDARVEPPMDREALFEAWFDHEADPVQAARLRDFLRRDPSLSERFARTQRAISMIRRPVAAPDVTEAVLARVSRRRRFLPERLRRVVTSGRAAVAAAMLAGLLTVAVIERSTPDAVTLRSRSTPVSRVMDASQADLSLGARQLTEAMCVLPREIGQPIVEVAIMLQKGDFAVPMMEAALRQRESASRLDRLEIGRMPSVMLLSDVAVSRGDPLVYVGGGDLTRMADVAAAPSSIAVGSPMVMAAGGMPMAMSVRPVAAIPGLSLVKPMPGSPEVEGRLPDAARFLNELLGLDAGVSSAEH